MGNERLFKDIKTLERDGSARAETGTLSEDSLYASERVLLVMDGATVVNGDENHFAENASDAWWLSHKGTELVAGALEGISRGIGDAIETVISGEGGEDAGKPADLREREGDVPRLIDEAIYGALCELEREYVRVTGRDAGRCELTPADVPSSTLSFAILAGGRLWIGQLGDSPISVLLRDGTHISMFADEALSALDAEGKERMSAMLEEGLDLVQIKKRMAPFFCDMRRTRCNNGADGSYRIFCFAGKEHARAEIAEIDASDVESVMICSDGYAEILDFEDGLDLMGLHVQGMSGEPGIDGVADRLARHQEEDGDLRRVTRFKKGDDVAVVAARVGQ